MDLILWRHAEALDPRDGEEDLDRPLTSKGERQAARVADWLGQQLPASTRVLVSPARRAQQTAAALERKSKTVPALAPDAGVAALLSAARWPDAREPVLVIGHQPTLGLTAAYLLSGQAQTWPLRKGGVIWLRSREREGQAQVLLHAAIAPELL
jgi:phosphohistidine phosphatase